MFCHVSQRAFSDLSSSIDTAAVERRLPYMGALELTYRCNQACCHCYCNLGAADRRVSGEMTTTEIFRLLDEAAEAGCFWLLLTGGEVLLRPDFSAIYMHALKKGMLVEVFTNATLIDEELAAMFAEFPPLGIEISVYGSNAALHDSITRSPGAFAKMLNGIELLRQHRAKFSLKTVLMSLNYADLGAMRRLSGDLGAQFRYDTMVSPRIDGNMSPAQYRLSADVMADMDIEDDRESCERIFAGFWNKKSDEILACGAGIFAFNINPYGVLSPCTMFRSFQYPLAGVPFAQAWQDLVQEYGARKDDLIPAECAACSMLLLCPNCPAWSELEAKAMTTKVPYICDYARSLENKFLHNKEVDRYGKKTV